MDADPAIDLHPDAKQNFDEKARLLAAGLTVNPPPQPEGPRVTAAPYVEAVISNEDLVAQPDTWGSVDHAGEETARYFMVGNDVVAIEGENHATLRKLAEAMQRTQALRDKVSTNTLVDLIARWMSMLRGGDAQPSLTDVVLSKCREMVAEYTVILPLYDLFLEEALQIGRVTLRTVSASEIDEWVGHWIKKNPGDATAFEQVVRKWRKALQGKAAATITLTAEPNRAYELARQYAEDALSMLWLFSAGMILPKARCYWTLLGSENTEKFSYFLIQNGELKTSPSGFYRYRHTVIGLNKAQVAHIRSVGLDAAGELLVSRKNDYQEKLLEALLVYSRAAIEDGLAEKLLYIIVGLEAFLGRNAEEPIQQNLAERLAFTIGRNLEERKLIIRVTKNAYQLRSRFIHHGSEIEDLQAMQDFMDYALTFFLIALQNANRFPSHSAFLDYLENRKLS